MSLYSSGYETLLQVPLLAVVPGAKWPAGQVMVAGRFATRVALFWMLKPGTEGGNRFGAPPPPNTLGVKILGWLFPLLVLIGMFLGAYQGYSGRV